MSSDRGAMIRYQLSYTSWPPPIVISRVLWQAGRTGDQLRAHVWLSFIWALILIWMSHITGNCYNIFSLHFRMWNTLTRIRSRRDIWTPPIPTRGPLGLGRIWLYTSCMSSPARSRVSEWTGWIRNTVHVVKVLFAHTFIKIRYITPNRHTALHQALTNLPEVTFGQSTVRWVSLIVNQMSEDN